MPTLVLQTRAASLSCVMNSKWGGVTERFDPILCRETVMPNGDVMGDDVVPEQGLGDRFAAVFQKKPRIYRAAGRVNLIGEHTDYNDGFVMPAAAGFYTWVAAAARIDRQPGSSSDRITPPESGHA
jgi:hypothetical protein